MNGSRSLAPGEKNGDKVVRITNPVADRTVTTASFEPPFPIERFNEIQHQMDLRGASQSGDARPRDPSKFPLSTRVIDLTDGCGSIMYGSAQAGKKAKQRTYTLVYKCGRYMRTSECYHNKVDAERLLEVLLRSIKHMVRRTGTRSELTQKLMDLASRDIKPTQHEETFRRQIESSLETLKIQRIEIAKKLAVEPDPGLISVFREEYEAKGKQLDSIQVQLSSMNTNRTQRETDPEEQVARALGLLDQLERLASVPEARPGSTVSYRNLGFGSGSTSRRRHGASVPFGESATESLAWAAMDCPCHDTVARTATQTSQRVTVDVPQAQRKPPTEPHKHRVTVAVKLSD